MARKRASTAGVSKLAGEEEDWATAEGNNGLCQSWHQADQTEKRNLSW
jgi:hypothetical protein